MNENVEQVADVEFLHKHIVKQNNRITDLMHELAEAKERDIKVKRYLEMSYDEPKYKVYSVFEKEKYDLKIEILKELSSGE